MFTFLSIAYPVVMMLVGLYLLVLATRFVRAQEMTAEALRRIASDRTRGDR